MVEISIERGDAWNVATWVALRQALWPEESESDLHRNAADLLSRREKAIVFLARTPQAAVGFAEATLRSDYVNGCATSPVAFLEGLYVEPAWRKRGIARRLVDAIEQWARERQCRELASDTYLDNEASQRVHRALHFEETERVVYFRKAL